MPDGGFVMATVYQSFTLRILKVCSCCVSVRYESERVSNESTYWLVFEILWRDFFRFSSLHSGKHKICIISHSLYIC